MTPAPWERQQGESEEAWAKFNQYLDMGEDRTLEAITGKQPGESIPGNVARWSSKWKWVERARAYDNWRKGAEKEAERKEIAKRATERERRRQRQVDISLDTAERLRAAALTALKAIEPHLVSKVKRVKNDKGEVIEIHPAKVTLKDIATVAKIADDLERTALDLSLGKVNHEVSGPNGGPIQVDYDLSRLSDAELEAVERALAAAAVANAGAGAGGDRATKAGPEPLA